MRLAAFNGPSRKPPYRRKNFAKISYASRVKANFVTNFVAMATGVGRGKTQLHGSIRWPIPKNPPITAKIWQKSFTQTKL